MVPGDIATQLVELVQSECEGLDEVGKRIVANRLAELVEPWRVKKPLNHPAALVPYTEAEAIAFEQEVITFGMHSGKRYADVPLEYLQWLADQSRQNFHCLWRYLKSERVKREER